VAYRYFNKEMLEHGIQAHVSVMDGEKAVELPVVNGIVSVPDALHSKVVMGPGWVKYVGREQASASDEELQPLTDVDTFYNGKGKKGSRSTPPVTPPATPPVTPPVTPPGEPDKDAK